MKRCSLLMHAKTLAFKSLKLTGRENEVGQLHDFFCREIHSRPKVVFVGGYSGVGKTRLISTLDECVKENGYICVGKQEQLSSNASFDAIAEAMTVLANKLVQSELDMERINDGISHVLSPQLIALLLDISPGLQPLFQSLHNDLERGEERCPAGHKQKRVQLAYRKLFSFLTTKERPIILILEDLHWADGPLIDLIASLATDTAIEGLMLVGSYRDNEMTENHPLSQKITELAREPVTFLQIKVKNLEMKSLNRVIAHLVESDQLETLELSEIVLAKTHGNVFYALQMMGELHQRGFIHFDMLTCKWRWDLESIKAHANVTDNVVDLVCSKLKRLSNSTQEALKVGACIGSRFDGALVEAVLRYKVDDPSTTSQDKTKTVHEMDAPCALIGEAGKSKGQVKPEPDFDAAVRADLLSHFNGTTVYKFCHDKVQQAAYSLFASKEEQTKMHYDLGRCLLHHANDEESDNLLAAAEQLHLGSDHVSGKTEIAELTKVYIQAGQQAMKKAAFRQAKSFLDGARRLMPSEQMWMDRYDLTWSLFKTSAEVNRVTGDYGASSACLKQLQSHAASEELHLEAAALKMRLLESQGEPRMMVNFGVDTVRNAGVRLPRKARTYHVIKEYLTLKRLLKNRRDEDIVLQPEMVDERMILICSLLNYLGIGAFFANDSNMMVLASLRSLKLSLMRYGPCVHTTGGWSIYGVLLASMGDFEGSAWAGDIGEKLAQRFRDRDLYYSVMAQCYIHAFLIHLRYPIHDNLDPCLNLYSVAIECGNPTGAYICCNIYVAVYFFAGLSLEPLVNEYAAIHDGLLHQNESVIQLFMDIYVQAVFNLTGRSVDPFELNGEALDAEKAITTAREKRNNIGLIVFSTINLCVRYILDPDDERTEQAAYELWKYPVGTIKTTIVYVFYNFYSGMIAMRLFRKSRKRMYKRVYTRSIKAIEEWERKKVPWVSHYVLILKAERAWLDGKSAQEVKHAFGDAIRVSARTGFTKERALANERLALFFREEGDDCWSRFYMEKAVESYLEWGASTKVDMIVRRYDVTIPNDHGSVRRSCTLRARERLALRNVEPSEWNQGKSSLSMVPLGASGTLPCE